LNLGYIYYNAGKVENALAEYEKALAIDPINKQTQKLIVSLHINQGNKYMQARNYSAAITEFEKIPVELRNVDIYNTLGYLYMEINQFSQAIAQFDQILSHEPRDKTAYQNLKWMEFTLKRQLEQSDSSTVRDDLALTKSSLALNLLNREEEMSAKAKLREALDLNPQDITVRKVLISTCLKLIDACQQKKWQKSAAEAAQWVLEIDPQNKPARQILQRN
jgi:tetratricopeptide (TPR) repeat protein